MSAKEVELIKAKLLEMHSSVGDLVTLCEQAKPDDSYYGDEATSMKQLGVMIELQFNSIESHERTVLAMREHNIRMAEMDKMIEEARGKNTDRVAELLKRAEEAVQDAKKPKGKIQ